MKRKKFYVSIGALLFGAMVANAQNAIVATGSDAVGSQGTAGISVGQIAVETAVNGSGSVLLGIQQDFSGAVSAVATNPIQNVVVEPGENADGIRLDEYFMSNEALTYTATSTDNAVARPVLNGLNLTFVLGNAGTATITVVATTAGGEQIPLSFKVIVGSDEPPTAVAELANAPQISVVARTIYVTNLNGCDVALYAIDGKRLYTCRNAMNTQITVPKAGVYVLMVCGKQHNIVVQ